MRRAREHAGFARVFRHARGAPPARAAGVRARRLAIVVLAALSLMTAAASAATSAVTPPDDPLFRHQWNLRAIQIPAAWAVSRGEGATVAVLDSGVAYETRGRFRRAPDLAGTRFAPGYDFVEGDAHPNDVAPEDGGRSHGTQMAGIIAQTTGNAIGGAGVAPLVTIMPIRVLEPDLSGSVQNVARGLRWAADHGADIANLSLAGPVSEPVVGDAIGYAVAKGVTVVAAAGNDGRTPVSWPAADPRVIAVGGVGRDLTLAPYSNYGPELDLVAPSGAGADVPEGYGPPDGIVAQTLKGGPATFCFCFSASTSAAAAQVSAVAALLVGAGRASGPADVRAALLDGARDLGEDGRDDEYGAGLVQAVGALRVAAGQSAVAGGSTGSEGGSWVLPVAGAALVALLAGGLVLMARRRRAR